ncbi:MAG: zinc-ribbon domain-containing protein [Faecousia sp.]
MAMIVCPECGKDISDKAKKCVYCGYPLANTPEKSNGTLVIYGYTGWYLVKPKLQIYHNGEYIGDLSYKAKTKEIPISEPTTVEVKCSFCSTNVRVFPGRHNEIYTEFDRATGKILAELKSY